MRRWLPGFLLTAWIAALASLGWSILRDTVAQNSVGDHPSAARRWEGSNSDALVALAEQRLAAGDGSQNPSAVRDLANEALLRNPLNEGALRVLGLAADAADDGRRADQLMSVAARRTRRDLSVETWLFDERFRQGRLEDALRHADAILRQKPDMLGILSPTLAEIARRDDLRRALIDVLNFGPPWRKDVLGALAQSAEPAANEAVFIGLEHSTQPLQLAEMAPYLNRLVAAGQYDLAFLTWLRALPLAQSEQLPYVYNGDFDIPVTGLPFDWAITNVDGATTEVADSGDENRGPALHVAFWGSRVNYHHVGKLLLLPPGGYRLTGLVKADDIENAHGLVWRIYCADHEDQTIGVTPTVVGNSDWTEFSADFEVPSEGCSAQWLRLEIAATVSIEQQISGTVWYDHLAIDRAPVGLSPAAAGPASEAASSAAVPGPT